MSKYNYKKITQEDFKNLSPKTHIKYFCTTDFTLKDAEVRSYMYVDEKIYLKVADADGATKNLAEPVWMKYSKGIGELEIEMFHLKKIVLTQSTEIGLLRKNLLKLTDIIKLIKHQHV